MREIGNVPDTSAAQRLADYLLTQGIRCRVDPHERGASIWVYEEDHRERAAQELQQFLAAPDDPRYAAAAGQARALERQAVADERRYRKNVIDVRTQWDARSVARRPVTMALIAISVVVALASRFGETSLTNAWTQKLYIAPIEVVNDVPMRFLPIDETLRGQWWRLVTPIFLHFGPMHLLFNLIAMADLGTQVERRKGSLWMLLLVLAIAVPSNLAQYAATGPRFGGMSGVAYGLFGYIWMQSRFAPWSGFYLHSNTVFMMLVWFVLCAANVIGSVANYAHGGGLAVGIVAGLAPVVWRRWRGL